MTDLAAGTPASRPCGRRRGRRLPRAKMTRFLPFPAAYPIMSMPRLLVTAAFALAACFAAPHAATAAPAATDELIWRGDQATGRSIMTDLAKEYAKQKKGKIALQTFSTVSGLDAVSRGTADIAGSARGKDARRAEEANVNFVPVALDAAVPITHPSNPVTSLTMRQLYEIYFGRITNWKELGGQDKPINLYAIAAPLDGIEYSLRELVFNDGAKRVAAPRLYLNTAMLEQAITLDPAGLGLSTLAGVHANKGVKVIGVEGVQPTSATIADGSYPLFITLYLAEREDSPKHEAIQRFIGFLATPEAKAILRRHQLVPYADATNVATLHTTRVAFIKQRLLAEGSRAVLATTPPTPVSAPRATLEAKRATAPTAESTQQARANLARAEQKKAAAGKSAPAPKKAVASVAKKPAAAAPAKPKVAKATPAKPASKNVVAGAVTKPAKKPAEPKKPAASFGNVSGGANSGG